MTNTTTTEVIKINEKTKVSDIKIHTFLKQNEKQILSALPKHLNSDRLIRIALTELSKTPKLKECRAKSLFGAIIQCSQLGLEPGSALGQAYLIPYGDECQFIIGYRGMIDLARRSGQIVSISAQAVYERDEFDFEYGLNEKLKHVPSRGDRGNLIAAYAIAHLKGGGYQIEVMFKGDIDKIRNRSKASKNGPWVTDYDEMAKKTVVRRLFKYLPISIEIAEAIEKDYKADDGEQNNNITIDGEFELSEENNQAEQKKSDRIANRLNESNEMPKQENKSDNWGASYDGAREL